MMNLKYCIVPEEFRLRPNVHARKERLHNLCKSYFGPRSVNKSTVLRKMQKKILSQVFRFFFR